MNNEGGHKWEPMMKGLFSILMKCKHCGEFLAVATDRASEEVLDRRIREAGLEISCVKMGVGTI